MARDIRTVRAAAVEALGSFRFHQFAPFAWILGAELLLLVLAMNLGTAWGMATAGWLSAAIARSEGPLHYPAFYAFLPNLITNMEVLLYLFAGSVLIPLAILRVLRDQDPPSVPPGATAPRVKAAIPVVFVSALICQALILGAQWVLTLPSVSGMIRSLLRGGMIGATGFALVTMLVGYAIWTLFVYVPVAAVQPGRSFGDRLVSGIKEGSGNFFPTYLVVIGISLPAAAILLVLQGMGSFLVGQIRPEIIGVLLGVYVILSMLATFFIYSAVARYYQARHGEAV